MRDADAGAKDGIMVIAPMPGAIATNLQSHVGGMKTPLERRKTREKGAATSVFVATSPLFAGIGRRYFVDCNQVVSVRHWTADMSGVAPYALDSANAEPLWEESLRLIS